MDGLAAEFHAVEEAGEGVQAAEGYDVPIWAQEDIAESSPPPAWAKGAGGFPRLPIDDYREEILERVRTQRVTFIQGDTGCGKSSMVPQFLLQAAPNSRILVTQPRRLAAISLSNRVGGQLGNPDLVGYRLGQGERRETADTRITFCTTGYLLQFLSHNPGVLKGFHYVLLDEVHERSMDSDLLLLLLKLLMRLHSHLKLVVMSATLQPRLFTQYFTQFKVEQEPMQVGGLRYPIERYFLDDVATLVPSLARSSAYRDVLLAEKPDVSVLSQSMQTVLLELIVALARPGQCLLVFLPGIGEIEAVQDELLLRRTPGVLLDVLPLHSLIPMEEQDRVLQLAESRRCKVVLATNLAESSITIPDAHCVIDTGLRRGVFLDERTGRPSLLSRWVSQASARQRAGRTGRVAPGKAVHLFTRQFHDNALPAYDEAEMSHASLERTVITTKLLLAKFGSIRDLLAMAITPPSSQRIQASLEELYKYGAFTTNTDSAEVTIIGRLAAQLPLDLPLVRLVLFGHLAGCLPECVVIAAVLAQQDLFTMPSRLFIPDSKRFAHSLAANFLDRVKLDDGRYSEALGGLALYADWLERRRWASSVSVGRALAVDLAVADICRTLGRRALLPLGEDVAEQLGLLQTLAKNHAHPPGATQALLGRQNVDLLYFVIGMAGAPNYLRGRVDDEQQVWELTEMHGLDEGRTVLLKSVPTLLRSPETLKQALELPMLKVDRVVLSGAQDALVELAPDTAEAQVQQWTAVRDVSFGCKLLHQLYSFSRQKLPILNPRGTTAGVTELPLGNIMAPRQVAWTVMGTEEVTARINPRSPLVLMADLDFGTEDWNPHVAVAFSFLGTQSAREVFAGGVTVLPSGAFGAALQLLMARTVRKVRAVAVAAEGAEGEVAFDADGREAVPAPGQRAYVISEAEVEHNGHSVVLSFRPNLLGPAQWDRINAIRGLLNDAVLRGRLPPGPVLQTMADQLLQELQNGVPEPTAPFNWYLVEQTVGPEYLPLLLLGQETEEVEVQKRQVLQQSREERKQKKVDETYERFRSIVRRIISLNPDGIASHHFSTHPAMAKAALKEQRILLGYPTMRDLLESMPDIVLVCTPPPGHPLRPNEKLLRMGFAIFPAGYQFPPIQQAPPPGAPVVTKLVNVLEAEGGAAPPPGRPTGFQLMDSLRRLVVHERQLSEQQLLPSPTSSTALAVASPDPDGLPVPLARGLPAGMPAPLDDGHPLPTTALLAEKLRKLLRPVAPPPDALPVGKKVRPPSAWRPMARRPWKPLEREFRDVVRRALQSFPEGCPFVEFVARVDALMPRTLAPGSKNRQRLLKPNTKKISVGELIRRQRDLIALVEAKCPGGYLVKPAPPDEEPAPRIGERLRKRGRVRSCLRRARRSPRVSGAAGRTRAGRRRARLHRRLGQAARRPRLVRSRVRAKTVAKARNNVFPPFPPPPRDLPKRAKNLPQPGQVPDPDYLGGEVYLPLERLDLTAPRLDDLGRVILPTAAFQFHREGLARPIRSLRPEYVKARNIVGYWVNQPEFQDGGPMRQFARFIAKNVGAQIDKRMKYMGYDTYADLIRSMPDLVSCRRTEDGGEWVYPAPPGLLPPPNLLTPIPMPNQVEGTFTPRQVEGLRRGRFPDADRVQVAPNAVIDMGPQVFFRTPKQNNEFQWFRRLIARTVARYKNGVTVEKFRQAMRKSAGKAMKKRRKNIGFKSVEDLLRSVPDLVTVRNDSEIGDQCTVLPAAANTYVAPGNDPLLEPIDPTIARRGWWNTNLQDDYNLMRDCAQKVLEEFPNGIYFMKFLKYFKGHLGRDPKKRRKRLGFPTFDELIKTMPDVVYLQEDPLVPGGLVAFPAALAPDDPDQQIQRPDWLLLRDITERTLLEYPVGLSLPQFALASTLGTPPAVERREELGYRSLADLLRSMPGTATVHTAPENPEGYIPWITQASYDGPIPEFEALPKRPPVESEEERAERARLPGHLRPGFPAFRRLVRKHIAYFPADGVPLADFIVDAGLRLPRWRRRMRAFGYRRAVQLLQAMPDVITLVRTGPGQHDWHCTAADPARLPAALAPARAQRPLDQLVQPLPASAEPRLRLPPSQAAGRPALPGPSPAETAPSPALQSPLPKGRPATRATQLPYRRDAAKADPPGGPSPPATRDTVIVVPGRDGAARELVVPVLGSSWPQPPGQYNLLRDLVTATLTAHNVGTLACASAAGLQPPAEGEVRGPAKALGPDGWAWDGPILAGLTPSDVALQAPPPPAPALGPAQPTGLRAQPPAPASQGSLPGLRAGCRCPCHPARPPRPPALPHRPSLAATTGCIVS